ncbi:MAG: hypothetical protein AABO58_17625 [Acidobacteriota bacterium]
MRRAKTRKPVRAASKGVSAWLITWVPFGEENDPSRQEVAAILNYRFSAERVRQIVDVLHQNRLYTVGEKLRFMSTPQANPYPAEFEPVAGGGRWQGHIWCGHEPQLFARLVTDLRVTGSPPNEAITWKERPRPENLKWFATEMSRPLPEIVPLTPAEEAAGDEIWSRIRRHLDLALEQYNAEVAPTERATVEGEQDRWRVAYLRTAAQTRVVVSMHRPGNGVTCCHEYGRGPDAGITSTAQIWFEDTHDDLIVTMPPNEQRISLAQEVFDSFFAA